MDTLIQLATEWGYWGLFIAAFVAGTVLPFSSEAVMVALVSLGLNPILCLLAASTGNTLGGMTCYWIGSKGNAHWIEKFGVKPEKLEKAKRFVGGRGAFMALFTFLPTLGEAIAVVMGLMHSNVWITAGAMYTGKLLRYIFILLVFKSIF